MDVAEWLALAGVFVAVVLGLGAILAARKWGNRRKRLFFVCESVPMLPTDSDDGHLQVTYQDFPIPEPYLVKIRLRNVGSNDVATMDFDADQSFRVELNCTMFGVLRSSHPSVTVSRSIGAEAIVEFSPSLLRSGDEWRVDIVVGGNPAPSVRSPLINTDIVEGPSGLEVVADYLSGLTLDLPFGVRIRIPRKQA